MQKCETEANMQGHYRIIPEFIARNPDLNAMEMIFYSLISALMQKYGFCWATNDSLAEQSNASPRTIRRYIAKLKKLGLIIVEIEYENERKIWTPETWEKRENLLMAYGADIINSREKFNQRFYSMAKSTRVPRTEAATYIIESNIRDKEKHREELPEREKWAKPVRSSLKISSSEEKKEPGVRNLPREMTDPKLSPPTPGRPEMVAKTKEFLSRPFTVGSQKVKIHQDDVQYFFGFSPTVIANALEIVHQHSRGGIKIRKIVAYLFKQCCKLRRQ
jgi:hypothetical protein